MKETHQIATIGNKKVILTIHLKNNINFNFLKLKKKSEIIETYPKAALTSPTAPVPAPSSKTRVLGLRNSCRCLTRK